MTEKTEKAPRLIKPESLEAKFKLMTLVPFDKRMKRKHILVYGFILDWFYADYGDALASTRHVVAQLKERDPFGQGLFMGDVHGALTDLVAWGYLTQEKGSGRRASRYVPVWSKFDSVHKTPNATEDEISVRETPNTSVLEIPNATANSVHKTPNEDPPTRPGRQTEGQVVGNKFDDAAAPPPPGGLKATAAVPPSGDGFEEFWKVWPRKHGLKKARAEWAKISHDVDMIIEAAGDWAAHYAKNGTDRKWIPEPANWLRGERWREDLPLVHLDAKGAAISKAKANAPLKAEAPEPANDVYRHVVVERITPLSGSGREAYEAQLCFKDCEPDDDVESITQRYDARTFNELMAAVGIKIKRPGDEDGAIGRPAILVVDADSNHRFEPLFRSSDDVKVSYEPLPEKPPRPARSIQPWRMAV